MVQADCLKNFLTGYVDEYEVAVLDPKKIAKHYIEGWFVFDFLSSIPIDPIIDAARDSQHHENDAKIPTAPTKLLKVVRLLRLGKLVRLLRATRVFRYIRYARQMIESKLHIFIPPWVTKISSLLIMILIVGHWFGSIQFMIQKMMERFPCLSPFNMPCHAC